MNADSMEQVGLLLAATAVFALAGVVKGVVGLGLPTVSMALLALLVPTGQAAAWLLLPSLVTNVLQMRPVGTLAPVWRSLWPLQAGVVLGTLGGLWWWGPVGAQALGRPLLGGALVAYALWGLWGRPLQVPVAWQGRWQGCVLGMVAGGVTGLVTALTGVFVVPAVAYLQALQLPRTALVQAMGLSFTVSTVALGVGMATVGQPGSGAGPGLDAWAWGISAAMLLPAWLGMAWGERLRARLSAAAFKQVLMGSLLALGGYLLCSGAG